MRTFGHLLAGRLAIALVIVVAVLCTPMGSSAFHEAIGRGHVSVAVAADHGHSHDVDEVSDDKVVSADVDNHHKHNPGDHSHEKLGLAPDVAVVFALRARSRLLTLADATQPSLSSTLDRPPRPSRIA